MVFDYILLKRGKVSALQCDQILTCQLIINLKTSSLKTMAQLPYPDIDFIRVIGSGCFGVVLEAEYRSTRKKCALKRIMKVGNQLSRQCQILKMIKGLQNVVQMEQIFYTKDDSGLKLVQNIVFEFVESNLQNLIEQAQKNKILIKESSIKKYIYQLLNGLKNVHRHQIAHRDLKPENVLLSDKDVVKICDFGSSKIIDAQGKNTPYIVSRYYRAPQLILCLTKYSTAIDVWAAGCIMAELYTLTPFFKGKTQGDQIFAIANRIGKMTKADKAYFKDKVPYDATILNSFDDFEKEDFNLTFKMSKDKANLIDLLLKLLRYNPEERITAKQALNHPYFDEVRPEYTKTAKK